MYNKQIALVCDIRACYHRYGRQYIGMNAYMYVYIDMYAYIYVCVNIPVLSIF